jgi:magnesium chelatase subunit D
MAERLPKEFTGHWCAALDTGEIHIARDGMSHTSLASITVIALDEGIDEESPPAGLIERLGLSINLNEISIRCVDETRYARSDILSAQSRLSLTTVPDRGHHAAGRACSVHGNTLLSHIEVRLSISPKH